MSNFMRALLRSAAHRLGRLRRHLFSPGKGAAELAFWKSWTAQQGAAPETEYYRKFMMDMGGVTDLRFFDDLVCVDIGCGPRGSLTWLTKARAAIGIDPLCRDYEEFGIASHRMIYLACRAEQIPLPTASVDIVFSMNSLDHVDDLPAVCREIRRLIRPGGWFIASLNLGEPPTATEPWTLSEDLLERELFHGWERHFYQVRPKSNASGYFGYYRYFYEECPPEMNVAFGPRALWCRWRVPALSPVHG